MFTGEIRCTGQEIYGLNKAKRKAWVSIKCSERGRLNYIECSIIHMKSTSCSKQKNKNIID